MISLIIILTFTKKFKDIYINRILDYLTIFTKLSFIYLSCFLTILWLYKINYILVRMSFTYKHMDIQKDVVIVLFWTKTVVPMTKKQQQLGM
jgi:Ni/Fe-hydrogenase subunit HybB-like protein